MRYGKHRRRRLAMDESGERVKRHRRRLAQRALQRVEVLVPVEDGPRLRNLAAALRNAARRDSVRRAVDASLQSDHAALTGAALFHFIGDPLFEGFELELPDRKSTSYEPIDLSEE
jgi:hypothetical protein